MPPAPAIEVAPLTPREAQVLTLAAQGLSDRQIARRLRISLRTVTTHMANLMQRLGACNRTHAVALGVCLGLVHLDLAGQPPPPAAPEVDAHGELLDHDRRQALWRGLWDAGPVGASPTALAYQVGRCRAWVYYHLRDWQRAGWAQPLLGGRWRALAKPAAQPPGQALEQRQVG